MNTFSSVALIAFGALWLYHATFRCGVISGAAYSNSMAIEYDLRNWATSKLKDGKLTDGDIDEIFSENGRLLLGGETRQRSFHDLIQDIVRATTPPIWPGVLAVLLGTWGVVGEAMSRSERSKQNKRAHPNPLPAEIPKRHDHPSR